MGDAETRRKSADSCISIQRELQLAQGNKVIHAGVVYYMCVALTDLILGQNRSAPSNNGDLISLSSRDSIPTAISEQKDGPSISAEIITAVIMLQPSLTLMEDMFTSSPLHAVKKALSASNDGPAVIFTAIEYNREDLVKLFLQYGADPNSTHQDSQIPVLAFAILNKSSTTNDIVNLLLSYGANPAVIPREFWDEELDGFRAYPAPSKVGWHKDPQIKELSRCITISIKYRLYQAYKVTPLELKQFKRKLYPFLQSVAQAEHFLVGQKLAIERVKRHLITHLLSSHGKPLVMVFNGPPGHGKTTFARLMGDFVPISSLINCQTRPGESDTDKEPTQRTKKDIDRKLTVIFVDSANESNLSQLVTFLDGDDDYTYPGQGGQKSVERSKTVCIIATTAGEQALITFHNKYIKHGGSRPSPPWDYLDKSVRKEVISHFPRPVSRHIGPIVPFMLFSKAEAIVLTHGFITKAFNALARSYRSLNLAHYNPLPVQHMVYADEQACSWIVKANYDINFGAPSIEHAVYSHVQIPMVERFMEELDSITECHSQYPDGNKCDQLSVYVTKDGESVSVTYTYDLPVSE